MLDPLFTMVRLLRNTCIPLLLLLALPAAAAEVITSKAGASSESGSYEMEAVAVINARPQALRYVISNLCRYREEMSHLVYCRVFKTKDNRAWSYALVDAPVIDPRDYVIVSEVTQDLALDGTGTYESRWKLDTTEGPPARDGIIRLLSNEGSWILKSADGGKKTQVIYKIKCAPGGNIPSRAVGYVQRVTLPDYVNMLERLANMEDRKRAVPALKADNPWAGVDVLPLDAVLPSHGDDKLPPPPGLPRP